MKICTYIMLFYFGFFIFDVASAIPPFLSPMGVRYHEASFDLVSRLRQQLPVDELCARLTVLEGDVDCLTRGLNIGEFASDRDILAARVSQFEEWSRGVDHSLIQLSLAVHHLNAQRYPTRADGECAQRQSVQVGIEASSATTGNDVSALQQQIQTLTTVQTLDRATIRALQNQVVAQSRVLVLICVIQVGLMGWRICSWWRR